MKVSLASLGTDLLHPPLLPQDIVTLTGKAWTDRQTDRQKYRQGVFTFLFNSILYLTERGFRPRLTSGWTPRIYEESRGRFEVREGIGKQENLIR